MKIKDIMSRDIATRTPRSPINSPCLSMRALDIGCMPVVEGSRAIGMITDRDIVTRSVAKNGKRLVKDVMSEEVISVGPESTSLEAAEIMAQYRSQ